MDGTAMKTDRVLKIYSRLVNGDILRKKELAQQFHVTERSVQRDMESLRCFLRSKDCGRISSMTKRRRVTDWRAPPVLC